MPTRKSGVDWKARCIETRKVLDKERREVIELLSRIHTYASMMDYEIDAHNFGFADDYCQHIIRAILESGYSIKGGNHGQN